MTRSWMIDARTMTLLVALATGSCTARIDGEIESGGGALPATDEGRRRFETDVLPRLQQRCSFCHADPAMAPAFLVGNPDVYDTVLAWPSLVLLDEPQTSRLLTKGDHDGPAMATEDTQAVLSWLEAEAQDDAQQSNDDGGGEAESDVPLCRDIGGFTTRALPLLEQHCARCHGGQDAEATVDLDLSSLSATAPVEACSGVAAYVDEADPMGSELFVAVNPSQDSAHPFDFAGDYPQFGAFRTEMVGWINAE